MIRTIQCLDGLRLRLLSLLCFLLRTVCLSLALPASPQRAPHDTSRAEGQGSRRYFFNSHYLSTPSQSTKGKAGQMKIVVLRAIRTEPSVVSAALIRPMPSPPSFLVSSTQTPTPSVLSTVTVQRLKACISPTSTGPLLQPDFFQPLPLRLQRAASSVPSILHLKPATSLSMARHLPPVYRIIRCPDTTTLIAVLCLFVSPFAAANSFIPSTSCID